MTTQPVGPIARTHLAEIDPVPMPGCDCRGCRIARLSPWERQYGFPLVPLQGFGTPKVFAPFSLYEGPAKLTYGRRLVTWECGCTASWWQTHPDHFRYAQDMAEPEPAREARYCQGHVEASPMIPVLICSQDEGHPGHVATFTPADFARVFGPHIDVRRALDFRAPSASVVYRIHRDGRLEQHAANIDSSD